MEYVQPDASQGTQPIPYNLIKDDPADERLSAGEMGYLWETYLYNSMMKCMRQYMVAKAQDPEIRAVLEYILGLNTARLNKLTQMFNTVGFPIPHAFTDEDVEPNAKRLFSDGLMLTVARGMANFELVECLMGLVSATRPDVKEYFNACIDEIQEMHKRADEVLLRKGFFVKPPYFPVPDRVEYVYQNSFFGGIFGKERPILALELTHVYTRLQTKMVDRAIILAFSQVAKSKKIRDFLSKGKKLADKHIEKWSKILQDEDLPIPSIWEQEITDSTESPFSDKLILFCVLNFMRNAITLYGISLANCSRFDIVTAFSLGILDFQGYAKDGLNLMISSGWQEKIPQASDRKEIIGLSQ